MQDQAPVAEPDQVPPGTVRVENTLAWTLAVFPVLWALLDVIFLLTHVNVPVGKEVLVGSTVGFALVLQDARRLRAQGVSVRSYWGLVLLPAYLWHRRRRTRQSYALPLVSLALIVFSAAITIVSEDALGPVTLDMSRLQVDIAKPLDQQTGATVKVSCPAQDTYWVHDTFTCTASDGSESVSEIVTVVNHDGTISWQPAPQS